ncbi:MAG: hypothetical protein ACOCUW_00165, partial [Gemmatimonadota bacterium]
MSIRETIRTSGKVALLSAGLVSVAGAASAQAAYSYVVRPLEASSSGDRVPLRVVQGPEVTWVVPEGGPLTLASAVAVLRDNAPVVAGPGSLLVRGWERAPAAAYDTLSVELIRGVRDRPLAGRTADHYVLRALVERRDSPGGLPRRHRVTADFWILSDVPFTWAPFAASGWLPRRFPHLREELEPRLSELGLVGRAEIRVEESLLLGGQPLGGDREAAAFEVSDLRRMEAPPVPGP